MAIETYRWIGRTLGAILSILTLYVVFQVYLAQQYAIALFILAIWGLGVYVFLSQKAYSYRYMFSGLLTFFTFIVLPLIYTLYISFTNQSAGNLLTFDRAQRVLLSETYLSGDKKYQFSFYQTQAEPQTGRLYFVDKADKSQTFVSELITLSGEAPILTSASSTSFEPEGEKLPFRAMVKLRNLLKLVSVEMPDGSQINLSSLREFAPKTPLYELGDDDALTNLQNGTVYRPDFETGYYANEKGERLVPGFRIGVGVYNYVRVVTEPAISQPFFKVFIWTIIFAGFSVSITLILGMVLAALLEWPMLRFRKLYRTLLILPYAVPAFISILVFRGLFNSNFGEINLVLDALLGIRPEWFADPFLAKVMVILVNIWLGYPYMMIVSTGILQSIPTQLYEASALDGAGTIQNFTRITAPLIIRPLLPLLISSFAFNFNNFVLIFLLTQGRPDMSEALTPVGHTDILVSYTFRLAFNSTEPEFGFASAIAVMIFVIVAVLSIVSMRLTNAEQAK